MKTLIFILLALPLSLFAQKTTTGKSNQKATTVKYKQKSTTAKPKQSTVQTPETLRHELILLNSKKEKSNAELVKIKSKWDASIKRMVQVRDKATATSKKLDAMNAKPSSTSKKERERVETQFNNELVLLDKLVGDNNSLEAQHNKKATEVKRLTTRIDKVQKQLAVVEAKDKKLATNKK